ncbi:cell wall hydrolase/autolysin [Scytonema sp. HK-05]|uniref:N-acetylmuramoyl-L-alanine amidase n=1 Tax=Scytonema sp. HK-05 TaxID=1137095 RepID=UPI000936F9EA|nr:N-acetylmuramoyl-L-alanine amidase [Scytonema sp. HK-05]OKH56688.1 N-acetylmuramoyl-L-alanine amidase [Scytonema sp. HK-05]BAY45556.1 cell wall hydrolase/autolysin [Scytonema sp. HK-05]
MKINWLLPGTVATTAIFMVMSPAQAAKLESWRFDANLNRLEINTEGSVQPQAQLIFNPTRLVIDLPGTDYGRPPFVQPVAGGAIRTVRVSQFDGQTTRIVIELTPGYTLDPKEVKFEGRTASRWMVQLPTPQLEQVAPSSSNSSFNIYSVVRPGSNSTANKDTVVNTDSVANKNTVVNTIEGQTQKQTIISNAQGLAQIENLRVTGDGLFVRINGGNPQIQTFRSSDNSAINIDIIGAALSPRLAQQNLRVNKYGIKRVEFTQLRTTPGVRMTLWVDKNSPDWQASMSSFGGLVVLPTGDTRKLSRDTRDNSNSLPNSDILTSRNPRNSNLTLPATDSLSTIESVDLTASGTQLLIKGDQPLSANGGWDRASGMFRITIPNAKLAGAVRGPNFDASSPVLRVRLQQQDPRTVVVYIQPAGGVQIGQLNQLTGQLLSLELRRSFSPLTPRLGLPPLPRANPRPLPPITNNPLPLPQPLLRPPVPNGRVVIMIDPGHGGKDSGAPGLGGLLEKDVVLPISIKIANILQQKGVQVMLTRNADYFVELQGRVDMADQANANLFVSIHANSVGARPDVNGLETYYYDSGLDLARVVHSTILQSIPTLRDRGVRRARFYVLRKSSMPSILVETGYMTGQEDNPRLGSPEYQNRMAEAIANGILLYLRQR